METNFELLNSIKYLISTGKSLKQVSVLLNLDLNYVKYLLLYRTFTLQL